MFVRENRMMCPELQQFICFSSIADQPFGKETMVKLAVLSMYLAVNCNKKLFAFLIRSSNDVV